MFNEELSIFGLLNELIRVLSDAVGEFEIIVVDDGSVDNSVSSAMKINDSRIRIIRLPNNMGKGNAVRMGIKESRGQYILIQDADREYQPVDIPTLLSLAIGSPNSAIYGSRFLGAKKFESGVRKIIGRWKNQSWGPWAFNIVLSLYFYRLTGIRVTDLLTGYKLYPQALFKTWMPITNGFETDHEITQHLRKSGYIITEVPIHYLPRTRAEGKKIRMSDGFRALSTLNSFK